MNQTLKYTLLPICLGALVSCASGPASDSAASSQPATAAATAPAAVAEIEYGNFTEDQLYQAIISELGARRGELDSAGQNYFDLAFATRDLSIIRRAVQFASVNGDTNALLQLGLLWTEVDPADAQPHLMLAFQFLEAGSFDQALSHMARVIDLGGDMDFSALAARTGELNPRDRATLIENLRQLTREFGEQESIRLALVQLLAQNRQFDDALYELQLLVQLVEPKPNLVLLQSQIVQSAGDNEQALRILRNGVRQFGGDKNLRLAYARRLIQNEDYAAAREQFQSIVDLDPQDWETLYSIALLDMELEDFDSAERIFTRLVSVDQQPDESQYYLGFIREQQQLPSQAIEHYRKVRIGTNNYLAAQQQATRLSIELGQLEDAHSWLTSQSRGQPRLEILFNTIESGTLIQAGYGERAKSLLDAALNKHPNDTDLLFARVLFFDNVGDRQGSERDLRQIIRMQPENAQALNHLGYMLADQTERHEEALELLERAIAVTPDDPAIIDSLGWAQYKLGRYEEAVANLRRAYAAFPDHEVASHLGEALWVMGRQDEAIRVWQDALAERPDSDLLKAVMDRFLPES
jgi:tetratricopeptide (TPR) repeat protein